MIVLSRGSVGVADQNGRLRDGISLEVGNYCGALVILLYIHVLHNSMLKLMTLNCVATVL